MMSRLILLFMPIALLGKIYGFSPLSFSTCKRGMFVLQASAQDSPSGYSSNEASEDTAKGKPVNDLSNPVYDEQGYTIHTNEETGEQKRVFDALVEYPCDFKLKIVGANEGSFVEEMVETVAKTCNVDASDIDFTTREMGKWASVTINAPVENADMLYSLYENIDSDPRVKFKV